MAVNDQFAATKGMTPAQRAAFDELMGLPAPQWPGLLSSYVRGTPVGALPDVAAEWAQTMMVRA